MIQTNRADPPAVALPLAAAASEHKALSGKDFRSSTLPHACRIPATPAPGDTRTGGRPVNFLFTRPGNFSTLADVLRTADFADLDRPVPSKSETTNPPKKPGLSLRMRPTLHALDRMLSNSFLKKFFTTFSPARIKVEKLRRPLRSHSGGGNAPSERM